MSSGSDVPRFNGCSEWNCSASGVSGLGKLRIVEDAHEIRVDRHGRGLFPAWIQRGSVLDCSSGRI